MVRRSRHSGSTEPTPSGLLGSRAVRISACLIVKDEQAFLDGCLQSLQGFVDEVVIVDTGSVDETLAIARRHGALVIETPWRDDFAAARNLGLTAASGDWILYIDADERLETPSRETMRLRLNETDVFAARVFFQVHLNSTLGREYRLFRNDPRLRFRGAIHETIRPDLDMLRDSIGAREIDNSSKLIHLGYEGDLTNKHRRNLPLLRSALQQNPDRLYYWNDLAKTLNALDQVDEAIEIASRGLARGEGRDDDGSREMLALLAYTNAGMRLARGEDVLSLVDWGLTLRPGNWSLQFLRARALIERTRYEEAITLLDALVAQDAAAICDPMIAHDIRIFGCYAHDLTGLALLRMGQRQAAAQAFSRAAAAAPFDLSYRVKALALGIRPALSPDRQ